jgi:hypothetical protein
MTREDREDLYGRLFRTVTKHFPDEPMSVRSDLVMALYQDVHKWATGESDETHGLDADVVEVDMTGAVHWVPLDESPED